MSTRNNEERSGARAAADAPPSQMVSSQQTETNTLDFSTPTEFVDLPSQGKFYPSDHPLHGKDSLEIRYMTAKDEDILTSKSLLKKGLAIDRLLQNIIVDKTVRISDLLIGDKNALVVAARVTGYGADYVTKVTCPSCLDLQDHQFNLEDHILTDGGITSGATATDNGIWEVVCPKSNVAVGLRLLTGRDEKLLMQTEQLRKKQNLPESQATSNLRLIIASVNGSAEAATITKFINVMPAQDARFVRKAYDDLMPNIDLTQHFECQSCGFDMDMEVPFTTDFFWPKQ
jgi:hypothetical protein